MDRITGVMMSLLTGQVCGGEPPLPALTADRRSVVFALVGNGLAGFIRSTGTACAYLFSPYGNRKQPFAVLQHDGLVHHHIVADFPHRAPVQHLRIRIVAHNSIHGIVRRHRKGKPQPS